MTPITPENTDDPILSGPDPMGAELAAWGRVLLLETRGRRSGGRRVTPVGFVEEPDGSLLIAAGGPDTAWAHNLLADAGCRVTIADRTFEAIATLLTRPEAQHAVVSLILRYGTPSEGLGMGPAFRLARVPVTPTDPA